SAAQHDVIRLQCGEQTLQDVIDLTLPFLPANALEGCGADALLERLAVAVRQMSEFHRLQNAIDDHRGAKTRSQAQEQHPAALVAADRLHQRIVDDLRRAGEGLFEIETGPPETEIV